MSMMSLVEAPETATGAAQDGGTEAGGMKFALHEGKLNGAPDAYPTPCRHSYVSGHSRHEEGTMARRPTSSWQWIAVPLICGTLGVAGCAGKPPLASLSQADLAVREAEKSTASQYAPVELQAARGQLDWARQAMNDEKYEEARRLADQALINAQLAEAKAGAEKARQAAAELQKSIEILRAELQRSPTRQ